MNRKTDSGLSLGALHEAGHAATLLILRRRFECVLPNKVSFGQRVDDGYKLPLPLMCQLAGAAAEAVGGGLDAWAHATTDGERAREAATRNLRKRGERVTAQSVADEMQASWNALVPLLREYWPAVEAIAAELEKSGNVTYARAAVLLEDARREQRAEEARRRVFLDGSDEQQKMFREAKK